MSNRLFNFILLFFLNLSLFSCIKVSPCDCWKYTDYQRNKQSCIDASNSMGFDEWDRRVDQCRDYRDQKDESQGYVVKDMVVTPIIDDKGRNSYIWKTVYVKK